MRLLSAIFVLKVKELNTKCGTGKRKAQKENERSDFKLTLRGLPDGLDLAVAASYYHRFHAGVAKSVYAPDSKSGGLNAHVGSSPTSGTNQYN